MRKSSTRRDFLKQSALSAAGAGFCGALPGFTAAGYRNANERPNIALIGTGIRYGTLMMASLQYSRIVAICDVDSRQLEYGHTNYQAAYDHVGLAAPRIDRYEDYRRILDRQDIDAVMIGAPDHWHAKLTIEAMRAGKDVYCEKPLTLTIAEGREIAEAVKATGQLCQVGTQQRSGKMFQTAVAMLREGRVGAPKRLTCSIGNGLTSEPLPLAAPPSSLNWNRWLGPAPWKPYRSAPINNGDGYGGHHPHSRAHAHFRWWYDYAGGQITDWGAHHIDIAMWALNKSDGTIGPYTIDPIEFEYPVEMKDGYPTTDDRFETVTLFKVRVTFTEGVELELVNDGKELGFANGIMFQGDQGRYFVNRGKLTGKPVEDMVDNPLEASSYEALYPGLSTGEWEGEDHGVRNVAHVAHFFDCLKNGRAPISDVETHHRHLTVCHAANIAIRLGRKLTFDPAIEEFVDDAQANTFLARERRKGFEIEG